MEVCFEGLRLDPRSSLHMALLKIQIVVIFFTIPTLSLKPKPHMPCPYTLQLSLLSFVLDFPFLHDCQSYGPRLDKYSIGYLNQT